MDTTNVCARCGTTVSGVWSSLVDPEVTYCWNCWSPAYAKAGMAGGSFAETMKRLLVPIVSPENLAATVTRAVHDATHKLRSEIETIRHYMNDDNEAMVDEAFARGELMEPATYGDFETISCYNCRVTYPIGELAFVALNRPWCHGCLSRIRCDHQWVDATNEVIESGEICIKCHAVRATISEEEKELQRQQSMPFKYIYIGGERYELGSEEAAIAEHLQQAETNRQFNKAVHKSMGVDLGNSEALDRECEQKIIAPDTGAQLVIKPSEGGNITIGEPRRVEVRDVLPNPVLLCYCCADRGKWWKFDPHCENCDQTGWSDKGVWAKDRDHKETEYAMDLSMYLCSWLRPRASEMAVRLAFHIDYTTNYVPDASKLIDQVFPTAQTIQRGASDGC